MRRVPLLAAMLLLVFAPAAQAGGWATVSLSSTPTSTHWVVDLTVLQHGITPLEHVHPVVTISDGKTSKDFAAQATGKPGTYRADVVFPSAGRWTYQVDDGFISQMPHTYAPVRIAQPGGGDDDGPNLLWLAPGIALLLAAAALVLIGPRLRRQPQAA